MEAVSKGMVWRCDRRGIVLEVISSDFPEISHAALGQPFSSVLEEAGQELAEEWLQQVSKDSRLLANLTIKQNLSPQPLSLGGIRSSGEYWLFWTTGRVGPASNLPQIEKGESTESAQVWEPDAQHVELLEELSRVNNELVNARRELIRQNIELHRAHQKLTNAGVM